MHSWTSIATLALLAQNVAGQGNAMLRFACSQLVVERTDPIVEPGTKYTAHLHQIVGGNAFNVTMAPVTYDPSALSTCTSCTFKEDTSNYWTAVLFFKAKNGSFKRVPQVGNGGPQGKLIQKGGLDVYYMKSGKITSFKPGFRMVVGNAGETSAAKVRKAAICHRCWKSTSEDRFEGGAPCSGSDTVDIPADPACKMIRQTLIFPHCWDGKNLDSPDHQAHMSFGSSFAGATGGSACPTSHPVRMPQVMFELMWNVTNFSNRADWPATGSPFTYSMNMGGSAAHGDYLFGWKGNSLQTAMDANCAENRDCPNGGIRSQPEPTFSACTKKQQAPEEVDGWLAALPLGEAAIKA